VAIYEVASPSSPWRNTTWEYNCPPTGNGVMWLMSTAYVANQPSSLAFTFYYNFINTGPAITGAIMYCGVDNYGYIILNGVKYPSTNPNMSLGYEGIEVQSNFTVNIPPGLNTIELRAINAGSVGNTVWQNQSLNGGPVAMWMVIRTSSSGPVLVKTDATWNCRQFDYPAKFIGPVSLGDVAENAGLSRPYSLAALSGKTMYDNSKNATTLAYPVSLVTTISKTFVYPSWTSTQFNWVGPDGSGIPNLYAWNVPIPVVSGTYSCRAVDSGNSSRFFSWTSTLSGGTISASTVVFTGFVSNAAIQLYSFPSYTYLYGNATSGSPFPTNSSGFFCLDFLYQNPTDAIYVLTVTRTS
jgi:hypothetical protein